MRRQTRVVSAILSYLMVIATPSAIWSQTGSAAVNTTAVPGATIDPAVTLILQRSAASLEQTKTAYIEVNGTIGLPTGVNLPMSMRVWGDDTSGSKVYMLGQGLGISGAMITDGVNRFTYVANTGEYTLEPALPRPAAATTASTLPSVPGMPSLLQNMTQASLVGKEVVAGQAAQRVRLVASDATLDLWFTDDARVLPIKANGVLKYGPHEIKFDGAVRWTTDQPIPASIFVIAPPPQARQVAQINPAVLQSAFVQALTGRTAAAPVAGGGVAPSAQGGGVDSKVKPLPIQPPLVLPPLPSSDTSNKTSY